MASASARIEHAAPGCRARHFRPHRHGQETPRAHKDGPTAPQGGTFPRKGMHSQVRRPNASQYIGANAEEGRTQP
jgi:hypothetical protein